MTPLAPIDPATVRYIKLGSGDRWFASSVANGRLELGHPDVSHELARAGDWQTITEQYVEGGRTPAKAKDFCRELKDFYELGPDCLWITVAQGSLWWTFAESPVEWIGGDGTEHGYRCRRLISPWRNTSVTGELLSIGRLSTRLTQVAAYQQTLCKVSAADYAVRRINGIEEPVVAEALKIRADLHRVTSELIAQLHWADFELLVDLIFARNGWRRLSILGDNQKDIDLAIEQPATQERAFVQVKSRATQAVLDDYVARFEADEAYQRMFLVCHSPSGQLHEPTDPAVQVWTGTKLASMAMQAGLLDWLIERAG